MAVYSPHTTFDAVNEGVNDWLLIPFGKFVKNISKRNVSERFFGPLLPYFGDKRK